MPHGSLACKGPVVVVIYQAGSAKPITRERPLTNHQLTFQPSPSIPRCCWVYNLGPPLTLKPTAPQFVFLMARIQKILFFLFLVFFLLFHGIEATRGKAMLPTLPQKGAAFFFPKMTVPSSGPSMQQNSVERLRFNAKRLVPSGANLLHH